MAANCTKTIRQLDDEAKGLLLSIKTLLDKGDDATPDEQREIVEKTTAVEVIDAELTAASQVREDALKASNRLNNTRSVLGVVNRPPVAATQQSSSNGDGQGVARDGRTISVPVDYSALKTVGQTVFEDEAFMAWYESVAGAGYVTVNQAIHSPRVAVKTLYTETADRTALGPLLGLPDRRPEVVRYGWMPTSLRDLATNLTTNMDVVEVVRETGSGSPGTLTGGPPGNLAAIVPEATASASNGVGVKPESAIGWEVIRAYVRTIAHWVPVTSRILADAGRLRGEIDNFLRRGIEQAVENEALNGDASGERFDGLNHVSGTFSVAAVAGTTSGQTMLSTTRRARTVLQTQGFTTPTAYLLNPSDWEVLDLTQDAEDRFYFGGPFNTGMPRLWGLPVATSIYQTQNSGICANFTDVVFYDRQQATIALSNQHSDFFVRNLIAILGEERLAMHVRRPRSVAKMAFS